MPSEETASTRAFAKALELVMQLSALANRATVLAYRTLSATDSSRDAREMHRDAYRETVDAFTTIVAALKEGSKTLGVSEGVARKLERMLWARSDISSAVDGFVTQAYFVLAQLAAPKGAENAELHRLSEMTCDTVATSLDSAASIVQDLIAEATRSDKTKHEAVRNLTHRTIRRLDQVTNSINIIAVNARIEASRAGDAGKSFGVIAEEVRLLSEEAQKAVNDVRSGMAQLSD